MNQFKIDYIEDGYCRINYKRKVGENILNYCLQDEGQGYGGVLLYRCSKDYEPSNCVLIPKHLNAEFEIPIGSTDLEKKIAAFITERKFEK